jgi:hypothetical protein
MLWTSIDQYHPWPFDRESELESAILTTAKDLFGLSRHYLNVKKLVGQKGKIQNIPDGYLIDLASPKRPVLYVVEVELETHHPIRHVAQQLLDFSLSFQSTPQKMKHILREELLRDAEVLASCESYATANGFHNIDYLLERLIFPEDAFNALVVIDELDTELESILLNSLRFPSKS